MSVVRDCVTTGYAKNERPWLIDLVDVRRLAVDLAGVDWQSFDV
jgi:hypothetical protein